MRHVLDSSSAGSTFPAFRVPRSNTTVKTGEIIPLEPLSFAKRSDVDINSTALIVGGRELMTCELERDIYESEKDASMMPTTHAHYHDETYDDNQANYERYVIGAYLVIRVLIAGIGRL
jgi:hypothetical protein